MFELLTWLLIHAFKSAIFFLDLYYAPFSYSKRLIIWINQSYMFKYGSIAAIRVLPFYKVK